VDERTLSELLDDVAEGRLPIEGAMERLRDLPYESIDGARLDHHRELRTGAAEAVYAPGKSTEQVAQAADALAARTTGAVFVTRATAEQAAAVLSRTSGAVHHARSGLVVVRAAAGARDAGGAGTVCVLSAGTSDAPVADEAARTAEALGLRVVEIDDVGVAGIHRVLEDRRLLQSVDCVIVVAGMEGALPSVVGGLTPRPVVAVPTSVGYGASFHGLAALLGMLSSCSPGVAVVNIDNGFGAAQVAHRIARTRRRPAADEDAAPERAGAAARER
jgi:NCAIR mutase (PurE)-related protein